MDKLKEYLKQDRIKKLKREYFFNAIIQLILITEFITAIIGVFTRDAVVMIFALTLGGGIAFGYFWNITFRDERDISDELKKLEAK